ncbi:MAG: sulfatase [Verrucomicrobiota bacterium]
MPSTSKPNILLLTSDQQHWATLGVLNPEIETPNLDRLAAQGALFTRAYCPNPTCTPTRASMITGQYPSQHGAYSLGTKLLEDRHTVGEDFQEGGYRTALVGKAHFQPLKGTAEFPSLEAYPTLQDLDFWRGFHGPFYGFEHVELARNHVDEGHVGQHYAIWMEEKGLKDWRKHFCAPGGTNEAQQHDWTIPEEYHYNTWIAERSCKLMEQYARDGDNFLLWSSFFDPHPPYLVPEPWASMYDPAKLTVPQAVEGEHEDSPALTKITQEVDPDVSPWRQSGLALHGCHSHLHDRDELAKDIAVYYGMVSCMDKYIGVILDKLDELGLTDDTLVVFTTDHGHFFGQHGLVAKGPFHYEDMIKLPFIARWPGQIPAATTNDSLISLVDLPPTFLSACGLNVPYAMTGIDQTEVLRGNARPERDHVIVENRHDVDSVNVMTFVEERYKITVYCKESCGELYDLREDPGELRNLWNVPEFADLKQRLLLRFVQAEMAKAPVPMPRVCHA